MPINRYDVPAQLVTRDSFYQLPFEQMAAALGSRQGAHDETEAGYQELALKQFSNLAADDPKAQEQRKWLSSLSDSIYSDFDGDFSQGQQRLRTAQKQVAEAFGPTGKIGAMESAYKSHVKYNEHIDELAAAGTINSEKARWLKNQSLANYKGVGEGNDYGRYNTFSGIEAAHDLSLGERAIKITDGWRENALEMRVPKLDATGKIIEGPDGQPIMEPIWEVKNGELYKYGKTQKVEFNEVFNAVYPQFALEPDIQAFVSQEAEMLASQYRTAGIPFQIPSYDSKGRVKTNSDGSTIMEEVSEQGFKNYTKKQLIIDAVSMAAEKESHIKQDPHYIQSQKWRTLRSASPKYHMYTNLSSSSQIRSHDPEEWEEKGVMRRNDLSAAKTELENISKDMSVSPRTRTALKANAQKEVEDAEFALDLYETNHKAMLEVSGFSIDGEYQKLTDKYPHSTHIPDKETFTDFLMGNADIVDAFPNFYERDENGGVQAIVDSDGIPIIDLLGSQYTGGMGMVTDLINTKAEQENQIKIAIEEGKYDQNYDIIVPLTDASLTIDYKNEMLSKLQSGVPVKITLMDGTQFGYSGDNVAGTFPTNYKVSGFEFVKKSFKGKPAVQVTAKNNAGKVKTVYGYLTDESSAAYSQEIAMEMMHGAAGAKSPAQASAQYNDGAEMLGSALFGSKLQELNIHMLNPGSSTKGRAEMVFDDDSRLVINPLVFSDDKRFYQVRYISPEGAVDNFIKSGTTSNIYTSEDDIYIELGKDYYESLMKTRNE